MDKITRKESSIGVTARVSVVDLAKMDRYWIEMEGTTMRSVSQLVGWCVGALVEVIEANGKMPGGMDSVVQAHKYLQARGLYQESNLKRSKSRIGAAMQMETLRAEGHDPAYDAPMQHRVIHSKHSVEPFSGKVNVGNVGLKYGDVIDEALNKVREEKDKETEDSKKKAIEDAEKSGIIVGDDWLAERQKKEKEIIEKENREINVEDLPTVE